MSGHGEGSAAGWAGYYADKAATNRHNQRLAKLREAADLDPYVQEAIDDWHLSPECFCENCECASLGLMIAELGRLQAVLRGAS